MIHPYSNFVYGAKRTYRVVFTLICPFDDGFKFFIKQTAAKQRKKGSR